MRSAFLMAAAALAALAVPARAADTFVQCDVKLDLPGGRLEAVIFGDGRTFRDDGRATLIIPVASGDLVAEAPGRFDLDDPAGQTAEYRVHMRWSWNGANPPPAFSKPGAKHPWWPLGDEFVGPALPASATPDKDWTYVAWASNGVQVKSGSYIYMPARDTPHRAVVGVAYQHADNPAEAASLAAARIAFLKAIAADDSFVLVFVNRQNVRLGAARVDSRLLKSIPDLSDRAHEEAARMQKAGQCRVSKL
ncbi:MAG: hypothetical protein GC145_10475 [Caulobacter sp.]|nr:hypothetical protein [Caulobacter sp.]